MSAPKAPVDVELAGLLAEIRRAAKAKQLYVASLAGCGVPNVSHVEHGRQHPSRELISAYLHLTRKAGPVYRRRLLAVLAGTASAVTLPQEALAQAVDASLDPDTDWWEQRLAQHATAHMRLGAGPMQERLYGDLFALSPVGQHQTVRPVYAKMLVLYARTWADTAQATPWYQRAVTAARGTGDPNTVAWVLGRSAQALCYETASAPQARAWVQEAVTHTPTDNVGAVGVYLARTALATADATLGWYDSALEHWDDAQRAYEQVDPDDDGDEFTCAQWRHCTIGDRLLSLAGHRDAAQWGQQAARLGAPGRFAVHLQLHRAIEAHTQGDQDAPAQAAAALEHIPVELRTPSLTLMAGQAGLQPAAV